MSFKEEIRKSGIENIAWKVNDITITCDCAGDHFEVELEGNVDKRAIDIGDFELIKDYIQNKLNNQYHRTYPFTPADMYPPAKAFYDPELWKEDVECLYPRIMVPRKHGKSLTFAAWLDATFDRMKAERVTKLGQPREIRRVIFNDPATIVMWSDGTKTVVKCQEGDIFDPEKGLAMAISKKAFGNTGSYCDEIKKWTEKYEDPKEKTIDNLKDSSAKINLPTFSAKEISDAVNYALKQFDEAMGVK